MAVTRRGFLRAVGSGPLEAVQQARNRPPLPPGVKEIKISSNENPLGPGRAAIDAITGKFPEAGRYPFNSTPSESGLAAALASSHQVKPENIVLGAGSQEILKTAVRAFTTLRAGTRDRLAVVREPGQHGEAPRASGRRDQGRLGVPPGPRRRCWRRPREPGWCSSATRTTRPPRSTASSRSPSFVEKRAVAFAGHGHPHRRGVSRVRDGPVLRDRGAARARDAERAGLADLLEGLRHGRPARRLRHRPARDDEETRCAEDAVQRQRAVDRGRRWRRSAILDAHARRSAPATPRCERSPSRRSTALGCQPTDSHANFLFVDIRRPAKDFRDACAKSGVLVGRDFPPFEKTHVRISIGTMEEMQKATDVFRNVLRTATSTTADAGRKE